MRRPAFARSVGALALLASGGAWAQSTSTQTAPQGVQTHGAIAPRTPGGTSVGAVQGDQTRMNATVGGINDHLLNAEKDRPRLPNQAPSPSQTLPGGTASGQTPQH